MCARMCVCVCVFDMKAGRHDMNMFGKLQLFEDGLQYIYPIESLKTWLGF